MKKLGKTGIEKARQAGRFALVLWLCLFLGAAAAHGAKRPPGRDRPLLVFTSFPSEGMGMLFERILSEAYGRIGYEVKVVGVPAERALVMSNQGEVDGEAARVPVIEPACPNLIRVPTPLYTNRIVAFTWMKGLDLSGRGWDALFPYRVGCVLGYKFIEKKTASMNRVLASCYDKLFTMLEHKRLDVAVVEYFDVLPALKVLQPRNVRVLMPPLDYNPMYHYLHKRHADLVPRINKVLKDMHREGRMRAIQREIEAGRGRPRCLGNCVVPLTPPDL